jgi:HlyD family secretion protein
VVDQNVTMFPVLVHLPNDERLLKPGMNTEVEIEIAQREGAIVVPNDAVVSMRDATTAAKALGLSEDEMRERMDAMRGGMRGGAQPTGAPGTQVAAATGTKESGRNGGAANQGNAGTASAECTALRNKIREGGRGALSAEDRTKLRACFAGMGGPGGTGGTRSNTARPGIVFVPGPNGPEPRMVTLGVNDWDYTEVLSGLKEGEQIFLMTAARLAQQERERADRMRQRAGSMGGMRQQQPSGQSGQGGGR